MVTGAFSYYISFISNNITCEFIAKKHGGDALVIFVSLSLSCFSCLFEKRR